MFARLLQRAARALRRRSDQRALFDHAADAIFVMDRAGRYVDVNPQGCALVGYSRAAILGMGPADLVPREHAASIEVGMRALRRGETVLRQRWLRHRDGSLVAVEVSARQLPDGRILSIARDLRARKHAEAELVESQRLVRRLGDSIPGVVYVFDLTQGRFIHMNGGVRGVLGHPAEHYLTLTLEEMLLEIHPDDRGAFDTYGEKIAALEDGAVLQKEQRMRHANGGWRWLSVRDTVFTRDADRRPLQVLGVADDVTLRRQLQDDLTQARKLESVGRLAVGIAHDFNNFLTVILGLTDLVLSRVPADGSNRGELEAVMKAARQAAGLTGQLLAFARKQVVAPRSVMLNDMIGEGVQLLARLLGERVELVTICAPDLGSVKVDPGQMMQVLVNLMMNASDAMPAGGRLTLETANLEVPMGAATGRPPGPGVWVRLSVADTGGGMDDEVKARLFEPFFTTKARGKGTGLGLATSYGAVAQAGGHVDVWSEPGEGTRFDIYLPRSTDAPERIAAQGPTTPRARGAEKVLVVEDERLVRETAVAILRGAGFEAVEAASAEEALRTFDVARDHIDLLLTDVVMPGMSGVELARRMRAARPELRVLFVSGYPDAEFEPDDRNADRVTFLQKPYAPDTLVGTLRELLDARKSAAPRRD